MYLLTETRVRHTTTENRDAKKGFGGGGGGGGGGMNPFG